MITGLEIAGGVAGIVSATANVARTVDGYKARKAAKREHEARFWRERLAEERKEALATGGIGIVLLGLLLLL